MSIRSRLRALRSRHAADRPVRYLVQRVNVDGSKSPTDEERAVQTAALQADGTHVVTWIVVQRANTPPT